jgi:Arc/MetJ-type ribon-helix-helix transcriptional regulator
MKTSNLPSVRVQPQLREQIEQVLQEGETLSTFVESSVRAAVQRRTEQAEFVARGLASIQAAKVSGRQIEAQAVIDRLQARLEQARRQSAGPSELIDAAGAA